MKRSFKYYFINNLFDQYFYFIAHLFGLFIFTSYLWIDFLLVYEILLINIVVTKNIKNMNFIYI